MSEAIHPDDDLHDGETLAGGRFVITGLLGLGATSVVYTAHDSKRDVTVALKILSRGSVGRPDREGRFEREARIGRRLLGCSNLVAVREDGELVELDQRRFVVLDYVRGPTLAQWMRRERATPALLTSFTLDLATGLRAMHERGFVHRDLKPANILVDTAGPRPILHITDFGLAVEADGARADRAGNVTRADQRPGTPAYMAPEQVQGAKPTAAWDVHALGLILYELATGRVPYAGCSTDDVFLAKLRGNPPGPDVAAERDDLSDAFIDLVRAALSVEPRDRPSAAQIVSALGPRRKSASGRTVRWIGVAAIAGLVVGGVAWAAMRPSQADVAGTKERRSPVSASRNPPPGDVAVAAPVGVSAGAGSGGPRMGSGVSDRVPTDPPMEPDPPDPKDAGEPDNPAQSKNPPSPTASDAPRPDAGTQPKSSARAEPAKAPAKAATPRAASDECDEARAEAQRAARQGAWKDVLVQTRQRGCWTDQGARMRLRVQAHAEQRAWPACIREGAKIDDPRIRTWVDLCRKKAMEG